MCRPQLKVVEPFSRGCRGNKCDINGFSILRGKTERILKSQMDDVKSQIDGAQNQSRSRVE